MQFNLRKLTKQKKERHSIQPKRDTNLHILGVTWISNVNPLSQITGKSMKKEKETSEKKEKKKREKARTTGAWGYRDHLSS
jgi:hypothetical protein